MDSPRNPWISWMDCGLCGLVLSIGDDMYIRDDALKEPSKKSTLKAIAKSVAGRESDAAKEDSSSQANIPSFQERIHMLEQEVMKPSLRIAIFL